MYNPPTPAEQAAHDLQGVYRKTLVAAKRYADSFSDPVVVVALVGHVGYAVMSNDPAPASAPVYRNVAAQAAA